MSRERSPFRFPLAGVCLLSSFLVLPLLVGCGGSGLVEITGAVTYDGQPVQKGTISFLPQDGNGPTAAAIIVEGKYTVKVALGAKWVKIEGYKIIGRGHVFPQDPASPMVDMTERLVPAQGDEKSPLKAEIGPGTRVLDFTLNAAKP